MPVEPVLFLIVVAVLANLLVMAVILLPPLFGRVSPLAREALAEVFGLSFEELPAEDGHGLWTQTIHGNLAARS